jgi:hypothetical protein
MKGEARSSDGIPLRFEARGSGGAGRQAWTMAAFGDDVVAVVQALGLGEVVLIGHSMGGDIVVEGRPTPARPGGGPGLGRCPHQAGRATAARGGRAVPDPVA